MNNYDYLLNNYNRAFSMNDFNMLTQADLLPHQNMEMPNSTTSSTNMNNMNMMRLYTPEEAYDKGNLFANLYQQYQNYRPQVLKATNEKERMFLEFSRTAFAAHELNLFLDNFPNNSSMLRLFNDYSNRANVLKEEYEKKYGPINVSSSNDTTPFEWENEAWPWEGEF